MDARVHDLVTTLKIEHRASSELADGVFSILLQNCSIQPPPLIKMTLKRSITTLTLRLDRSCCRTDLHRASIVTQQYASQSARRAPKPSFSIRRQPLSTTPSRFEEPHTPQPASSDLPPSKIYKYEDIVSLTESPDPNRILIGTHPPQAVSPRSSAFLTRGLSRRS